MRLSDVVVGFAVLIVLLFALGRYMNDEPTAELPVATESTGTDPVTRTQAPPTPVLQEAPREVFLTPTQNEAQSSAEWVPRLQDDQPGHPTEGGGRLYVSPPIGRLEETETEEDFAMPTRGGMRGAASPIPEQTSPLDEKRAHARKQLAEAYQLLARSNTELKRLIVDYRRSCGRDTESYCGAKLEQIGDRAARMGIVMDLAQDYARRSWLQPGEIRTLRERHGLDGREWDELIRMLQQYR